MLLEDRFSPLRKASSNAPGSYNRAPNWAVLVLQVEDTKLNPKSRSYALFFACFLSAIGLAVAQTVSAATFDGPPVQMGEGNNQTVQLAGPGAGSAVFAPISVTLVGPNGNSVPNGAVEFSCTATSGGKCFFGTAESRATILTGSSGQARTVVTVTGGWGPVSVRASRDRNAVTFALTVKPPAVLGHLSLTSGSNQQLMQPLAGSVQTIGPTVLAPVVVQIVRINNPPPSKVVFTCTPSCTFDSSATVTSDHNGNAAVTIGEPGAGTVTVVAALLGSVGDPVTTTLSAFQPSAPFGVSVVSGNNQTVARTIYPGASAANFAPISVLVKDSHGLPVPNVYVQFSCTTPNPTVPSGGTCNTAGFHKTDAQGIATESIIQGANYTGALTVNAVYSGYAPNPAQLVTYASGKTTFNLTIK
jgi:hypothetical protein